MERKIQQPAHWPAGTDDPDDSDDPDDPDDPIVRAAAAAAAGIKGKLALSEALRLAAMAAADPDPRVRSASLGALARSAPRRLAAAAWRSASQDPDASVRRRAAEVAPLLGRSAARSRLVALLGDTDPRVAEAAAWALGETTPGSPAVVAALSTAARSHGDPLVRESAVAALGSLGDPEGLSAVLAACSDRPAIRRRAVLALAPFSGPAVEAAIRGALDDPDWQVRQAAEDLLA